MGQRGPAPRTDAEKELAGVIVLPADIGECPDYLSDDAKECFYYLKPLVEKGICVATDRMTVIQYCSAWGVFVKAEMALQDQDYVTEDGGENPRVRTYDRASRTLLALGDKLGLNPACRARLKVEPTDADKETDDEREQFGT
jgi:P27 family predicted phage terminase small subunit